MGAVKELWWVIVMIGGPALTVVLWEKYQARKARKQWRELTDWKKLGDAIKEGLEEGYAKGKNQPVFVMRDKSNVIEFDYAGYIRETRRRQQKSRDDHTFKVVEEFRNGTAD